MKVSPVIVAVMGLNLLLAGLLIAGTYLGWADFSLPLWIPFHWNLAGEVDAYAPAWALGILGGVPPLMYFLMFFLPRINPGQDETGRRRGVFSLLVAAFTLFFLVMQWGVVLTALGLPLPSLTFIKAGLGVGFLILGIIVARIPPGFPLGVRTPWTQASQEIWTRTHRMAGWVFFFLGIWNFMLVFTPGVLDTILLFSGLMGAVGYLYYFSYREYKKNQTAPGN